MFSISKFTAKKLRRRTRQKGQVLRVMNRPGRNYTPLLAQDLWALRFRFTETPAKRAWPII